jgi:flagellar hook-basal body complex protein FliE
METKAAKRKCELKMAAISIQLLEARDAKEACVLNENYAEAEVRAEKNKQSSTGTQIYFAQVLKKKIDELEAQKQDLATNHNQPTEVRALVCVCVYVVGLHWQEINTVLFRFGCSFRAC